MYEVHPANDGAGNIGGNPVGHLWAPRWKVNEDLGLTMDDDCFVVLYRTEAGRWRPGTHIPPEAVQLLMQITHYRLDDRQQ